MKTTLFLLSTILSLSIQAQTWMEVSVPTQKNLLAIDFPSETVGYIVGEDSTLLKSTDGGETWTQLPLTGIQFISLAFDIVDVDFVDENIGFISAGYSYVYKTNDGGQTWIQLTSQLSNMCFPETIHAITEDDYFVGGSGCFSGALIDRFVSSSWTPGTINAPFWNSNEILQEFSFANTNLGLAATKSKYMLRTVDAGVTWDTVSTGLPANAYLSSVWMIDDLVCYAGYAGGNSNLTGILKSIDGGLSWDFDTNAATFYYPDFFTVTEASNGDVYTGGVSQAPSPVGVILENNPSVPTLWTSYVVDQQINAMDSYGDDVTFAVGDSGYVVVNKDLSTIGLHETILSESIDLYPNPAQEKMMIRTDSKINTLKIVDLAGNKQNISLNGLEISGEVDISSLNHGMYIVVLETSKGNITKKFCKE